MKKLFSRQKGFGLLEMIIYVDIVGLVGGILINFIFALSASFSQAKAQKEVLANARLAMDKMLSDIRYAHSVYIPTSAFGVNPGHLSMETSRNLPDQEKRTYFDYFVSSSRLYFKQEGAPAFPITSSRVKVTNLIFNYFKNGTGTAESVDVELSVIYDAPPDRVNLRATTSLRAVASVRGAY